jgi:hypothetical protein
MRTRALAQTIVPRKIPTVRGFLNYAELPKS